MGSHSPTISTFKARIVLSRWLPDPEFILVHAAVFRDGAKMAPHVACDSPPFLLILRGLRVYRVSRLAFEGRAVRQATGRWLSQNSAWISKTLIKNYAVDKVGVHLGSLDNDDFSVISRIGCMRRHTRALRKLSPDSNGSIACSPAVVDPALISA